MPIALVECPRCPRCARETAQVEAVELSGLSGFDECRCRCSNCGVRFTASTPANAWFVPYMQVTKDVPLAPFDGPHVCF
jgi:hypothetical protein